MITHNLPVIDQLQYMLVLIGKELRELMVDKNNAKVPLKGTWLSWIYVLDISFGSLNTAAIKLFNCSFVKAHIYQNSSKRILFSCCKGGSDVRNEISY